MKKNSAYSNEYFSLDDIVNLLQQEMSMIFRNILMNSKIFQILSTD